MWVNDVVLAIEPLMLKLEWLEKNINHCKLQFLYLFVSSQEWVYIGASFFLSAIGSILMVISFPNL